jgi:hypothetical protein
MSGRDFGFYDFKVGLMTHAAENGNGLELSRMLEEIPTKEWRSAVNSMMLRNQLDVHFAQRQNDFIDHTYPQPEQWAYRRQLELPVPPVLSNQVIHTNGTEVMTIYQGNGEGRMPIAVVRGYLPHHYK